MFIIVLLLLLYSLIFNLNSNVITKNICMSYEIRLLQTFEYVNDYTGASSKTRHVSDDVFQ